MALHLIHLQAPGWYRFPCSPEINWLVPLFPKNWKFVFLCSLSPILSLFPCSPQILAFVPLFPWNKCPFPPVPQSPCAKNIVTTSKEKSGCIAQSVTCLPTDGSLTADPGVASLIPAGSHTFVEIYYEIISTVILLPSAESVKKDCCQLQSKVCARSTG